MNRARFHGQSAGRRLFLAQTLAVFTAISCPSGAQQADEEAARVAAEEATREAVEKASVQNAQKLSATLRYIAFRRMPLESAITALLDRTDISYTLDGRLQTAMIHPLTLNNVTYGVALQSLLKASTKAAKGYNSYGVYGIQASFDDDAETSDWAVKHDTGTVSVTPVKGQKSSPLVNLKVTDASLCTALKLMFTAAKIDYALDDHLDFRQMPVTANFHRVPLRSALDALVRAAASSVPITYRVENGNYYSIVEKKV
jgi:hypothetical protein